MTEETTSSGADAAYDVVASEGGAGIPQLATDTFAHQGFLLVLTLIAIFMILTRVALPRLSAVMAARQGALTNDLAAAEDLKRRAAEAEQSYNQALADARAEAQRIAEKTRADIQADLQVELDKVEAEMAAQAAESTARIAEIEKSALSTSTTIAKDVASELVRAIAPDQKLDEAALAKAISNRAGS